VDAMPYGGRLTLRTAVARGADRIHVEVGDTGVGMNDETRRRCLEPFFTTKGERGTGLGLAMVYGVAQRHHAHIELESAPGKGTVARLSFPIPTRAEESEPIAAAPDPVPARMRILVVDDDPLLIKSLRETLEGDGHQVTTASGGQAGINAFQRAEAGEERFAVVITDLGMPHVDGRKVATAVKALSLSTPVILLTGWGHRMSAEGDVPVNVDRVLCKPPKLRDLRSALSALAAAPAGLLESAAPH
jgi:CheY-like chemotaxis protein